MIQTVRPVTHVLENDTSFSPPYTTSGQNLLNSDSETKRWLFTSSAIAPFTLETQPSQETIRNNGT